ncbi:MAG: DUF898 domain-containing protein [Gammaproteobacteria bacterium]|nr:DUF898 domain-containing protein [Gammaproteobacteria bacterium]
MNSNPMGATAAVSRPSAYAPRALSLRFIGSTKDYFRIWITNICLTLFTLGIYSAWAKVRKKRYFYSHTLLDDTPFQYLGQPLPILKGRIIAAVLFGAWYTATHFVAALIPIVFIGALVLAPWVVVRAAAFNARYSAFRNMTFHFNGSYWGAVKVLYGGLVFTIITLGFGFSWWQKYLKGFMIQHMGYGGINGEFSATGTQFFKTYFIGGLVVGVLITALSVVIFAVTGPSKSTAVVATTLVGYGSYVIMYAFTQARISNLVWNHTTLGPIHFGSRLRARELIWLYASNAVAILASAGLLIPWATIRMLKYRVTQFTLTIDGELHMFEGNGATAVAAAGAEVGEIFDFDMSI